MSFAAAAAAVVSWRRDLNFSKDTLLSPPPLPLTRWSLGWQCVVALVKALLQPGPRRLSTGLTRSSSNFFSGAAFGAFFHFLLLPSNVWRRRQQQWRLSSS